MSRVLCLSFVLLYANLLPTLSAADADKEPKTIAVFDMSKPISDKPTPDDPLFGAIGVESLHQFTTRLREAGDDDDVAAVVLLISGSNGGTSRAEEISQVLTEVKKNKKVYAHADSVTTGTYALMCGASRLSISPTGDAFVTGIYGEQPYLRGLFDWLQVQPDFLTCGDYKSAAEMFTRSGPSQAAAEMDQWLYDGIFDTIKNQIAAGRNVDLSKVDAWIDQGLFSAETAKESGLIDAVETREQLTEVLKDEYGADITLERKYGKKSGPNIDLNNPFAAFQLWAQILSGPSTRRSTKDAIAVVHIDGAIMLGKAEASPFGGTDGAYSEPIRKAINAAADDPRVKGIVLRVNSPGGSATASEVMLQSIMRAHKKKPVVVSMGSVAASGGYYVSCRAEKIFANESTITGSIGVVAGKLATAKMWERIGINFEPVQRGKKAGVMLSSRPFSDGERDELQQWMDSVYGVFKGHVTSGRKDLKKDIDDIAGGRVYTGKQALELGLVDEIGTLDDAIDYLVKKTNLEDYEIRTVPRPVNFLEELFADVNPQKKKDDRNLSSGLWSAIQPMVAELDPARLEMLQEALLQLELLQRESVIMTSPVIRIR